MVEQNHMKIALANSPIQLIVGLKNPTSEYIGTRHNIGAEFVDKAVRHYELSWQAATKLKGQQAALVQKNGTHHFFQPNTYMNNSGQAVKAIVHFYKIPVESVLVVHDELDLPVGTIRLKSAGGHGGHNGLRDIIEQLESNAFLRLRIGIGRPQSHEDVADYVLNRPSSDDKIILERVIERGLAVMPHLLDGNIALAMKQLHTEE